MARPDRHFRIKVTCVDQSRLQYGGEYLQVSQPRPGSQPGACPRLPPTPTHLPTHLCPLTLHRPCGHIQQVTLSVDGRSVGQSRLLNLNYPSYTFEGFFTARPVSAAAAETSTSLGGPVDTILTRFKFGKPAEAPAGGAAAAALENIEDTPLGQLVLAVTPVKQGPLRSQPYVLPKMCPCRLALPRPAERTTR